MNELNLYVIWNPISKMYLGHDRDDWKQVWVLRADQASCYRSRSIAQRIATKQAGEGLRILRWHVIEDLI